MSNPVLTAFKYDISCRDIPNTGHTWLIYEDFLNKGLDDPYVTDHIEIKGNLTTSEKDYNGLGFCMIVEGTVSWDLDEVTGSKYAIIG